MIAVPAAAASEVLTASRIDGDPSSGAIPVQTEAVPREQRPAVVERVDDDDEDRQEQERVHQDPPHAQGDVRRVALARAARCAIALMPRPRPRGQRDLPTRARDRSDDQADGRTRRPFP